MVARRYRGCDHGRLLELLHVHAAGLAREVNVSGFSRQLDSAVIAVFALVLLRGIVLAATPLSFDEAYYWLWSKHLAAGYLDHPPLIAFLIRSGTIIFGDTSTGVRFVPWLLSGIASWAVWRAAIVMTKSPQAGITAALLFNVMPMIAVESGVATPDAPEICAAAFLLLFLAEIAQTRRGHWWIAAGVAAGFALLAKYTAFFLGAGILLWLAVVPEQRHWFRSAWPYAGALIALVMFSPVILWNAQHGWISFAMQFGRTGAGVFTLRYLGEFLGGQLLLATPFIAILAAAGIMFAFRTVAMSDLRLPACMIVPAAMYFLWHSLHDRVQGNWPSFLYPAIAVSAAAVYVSAAPHAAGILRISKPLAVPVAAVFVGVIYAQAVFGAVPHVRDPVSRLLAYGMGDVVTNIEALRVREHAAAIVTTNYALTAWLSFYLPGHPPVIQLNERSRYLNEAPPDPQLFLAPMIYVSQVRNEQTRYLESRFAEVEPLGHVTRTRNGATIDEYAIYRVEGAGNDVLSFAAHIP